MLLVVPVDLAEPVLVLSQDREFGKETTEVTPFVYFLKNTIPKIRS